MPPRVLDLLVENFEASRDVIVRTRGRMGFADWAALAAIARPDLRDKPLKPARVWRKGSPDIFDEIRYRDRMVHHPFDSFQSVESFVDAAIDDPRVVAIKMTLYRIGANSPVVDRLIKAAERGKQVAVLVELKARFDERSNIEWAKRLEDAGVHVVYGVEKLKTHCKICLVVQAGRRRDSAICAHRHRQLQPDDLEDLHRHRHLHGAPEHRRRRVRAVQLSDGLLEPDRLPRAADRACRAAPAIRQARRARDGARPTRTTGAHHRQIQRTHRSRASSGCSTARHRPA